MKRKISKGSLDMQALGASLVAAALVAALVGCQTRWYAEKNAEQIVPIQKVVTVNGTNMVITVAVKTGSGGWQASARFPLWADEKWSHFGAETKADGSVQFGVRDYSRDLSANAVALTRILCDAVSDVTAKVCAAVVTHGGSIAASKVSALVKEYISAGGKAENACVNCTDGNCTITDAVSGLVCTGEGCVDKD